MQHSRPLTHRVTNTLLTVMTEAAVVAARMGPVRIFVADIIVMMGATTAIEVLTFTPTPAGVMRERELPSRAVSTVTVAIIGRRMIIRTTTMAMDTTHSHMPILHTVPTRTLYAVPLFLLPLPIPCLLPSLYRRHLHRPRCCQRCMWYACCTAESG